MAAAVVFAALAMPATASAGTYDVVACNAPGAGGVNNSWTGQATGFGANAPPEPQSFQIADDCAGGEKGLIAKSAIGGDQPAGFLRGASWQFVAPAGTQISRVTVWRFGFKFRGENDDVDPWFVGAQEGNGNNIGGAFSPDSCANPPGNGVCSFGADGGLGNNAQTYDLATDRVSWLVFCNKLSGCGRYFGDANGQFAAAGVELYGARVTLTDNSAPTVTATAGDGWRRPGEPVSVTASDNAGIRAVRAEAGGATAGGARSCDYTRKVPCSNVSGSVPLPAAPEGTHTLRVVAEDAAGNPAVAERRVRIDGTAPQVRLEKPRGRQLRVRVEDGASGVAGGEIQVRNSSLEQYRALPTTLRRGVLRARLDRGRVSRADIRVSVRDNAGNRAEGLPPRITVTRARIGKRTRAVRSSRVRVPFGRRAVLRGRMTLSAGQPVANAQVRVVSRVRRPGAPLRELGTVTTDGRGRFSARIPRGPSRTIGLRFEGREQVLRGARGVGVRVPAASTIRASRSVVTSPGSVRFSGRLRTAGAAIPDRGLVIILQGREDGAWQTFADTRTNRRGQWKASYRFRGGGGTFPIRARIRRQAGYPFELGYSRTLRVRVR